MAKRGGEKGACPKCPMFRQRLKDVLAASEILKATVERLQLENTQLSAANSRLAAMNEMLSKSVQVPASGAKGSAQASRPILLPALVPPKRQDTKAEPNGRQERGVEAAYDAALVPQKAKAEQSRDSSAVGPAGGGGEPEPSSSKEELDKKRKRSPKPSESGGDDAAEPAKAAIDSVEVAAAVRAPEPTRAPATSHAPRTSSLHAPDRSADEWMMGVFRAKPSFLRAAKVEPPEPVPEPEKKRTKLREAGELALVGGASGDAKGGASRRDTAETSSPVSKNANSGAVGSSGARFAAGEGPSGSQHAVGRRGATAAADEASQRHHLALPTAEGVDDAERLKAVLRSLGKLGAEASAAILMGERPWGVEDGPASPVPEQMLQKALVKRLSIEGPLLVANLASPPPTAENVLRYRRMVEQAVDLVLALGAPERLGFGVVQGVLSALEKALDFRLRWNVLGPASYLPSRKTRLAAAMARAAAAEERQKAAAKRGKAEASEDEDSSDDGDEAMEVDVATVGAAASGGASSGAQSDEPAAAALADAAAEAERLVWWPQGGALQRHVWLLCRAVAVLGRKAGQFYRCRRCVHRVLMATLPEVHWHLLLAFAEAWPELLHPEPEKRNLEAAAPATPDFLERGCWSAALCALLDDAAAAEASRTPGGAMATADEAAVRRLRDLCRWPTLSDSSSARAMSHKLALRIFGAFSGSAPGQALHGGGGRRRRSSSSSSCACAICKHLVGGGGGGLADVGPLSLEGGEDDWIRGNSTTCPAAACLAQEAVRAVELLARKLGPEWSASQVMGASELHGAATPAPAACEWRSAACCHLLSVLGAEARRGGGIKEAVVASRRLLRGAMLGESAVPAPAAGSDHARNDEERRTKSGRQDPGRLDFNGLAPAARAQAAEAFSRLLGGLPDASSGAVAQFLAKLAPRERPKASLPFLQRVAAHATGPVGHVISLRRRHDRLSSLAFRAAQEGLRLHPWEAIDAAAAGAASAVPPEDVAYMWNTSLNARHDSRCIPDAEVALTGSERACAASHLKLWRRHMAGGLRAFRPELREDVALILEDDAVFVPGFAEHAAMILKSATTAHTGDARAAFDVLLLGYWLPEGMREANRRAMREMRLPHAASSRQDPFRPLAEVDARRSSTAAVAGRDPVYVRVSFAWQLHAYLLTREGAAKLANFGAVSAPVDVFVAEAAEREELRLAVCVPPLASQSHDWTEPQDVVSSGTMRTPMGLKAKAPARAQKAHDSNLGGGGDGMDDDI